MSNRLGEILVNKGIITQQQLSAVLRLQNENGGRLGDLIVQKGMATERQVMEALSFQLGVSLIDTRTTKIDPKAVALISEELAKRFVMIPVKTDDRGRLILAMADPLNLIAIDEVELRTGMSVVPVLDSKKNILDAIHIFYSRQYTSKALRDLGADIKEHPAAETSFEDEILDAPAIRLVSSIIRQAVIQNASDIHIEPREERVVVRIRINGELVELLSSPAATHSVMIARLKILGHMNIAEHRVPQDGRTTYTVEGREVDLRISTLPTIYGEKAVIRILDHSRFEHIRQYNMMSGEDLELFRTMINRYSGMVLVTGPTGSGKTTTLYAALAQLNKENRNIITIEDPVEYKIAGINQSQVNSKAGYTFASGLRAILRQDPDVIMVGEIRDTETAKIAVRSAITGHLVLSTMHTQDTASTVSRLIDMDIEPYLISSALSGVVAQRLIRKICQSCKVCYEPSAEEKMLLSLDTETEIRLCRGKGCSVCGGTGYRGLYAIYELMPVYREIRNMIHKKCSSDEIRDIAINKYKLITLREKLIKHILDGITTIDEMHKVSTYIEH